ncbi:hypothetical protein [Prauserella muralis]|uniref:Uncharacterized protein n=1 Tax=Prauserella muralis TaxID=588067 RepID=A0A2V4ASU0_9PSEU|nr:hypothetical protein [Prauserella muralis]PXY22611.1 hypothetical protein BAY60_22570 [Prauserella muralis]TWE28315.1 hypothetical protein FHX69_0969 [Prauserella muralis]
MSLPALRARYVVLALGFGVLAGVRAAQDAPVWAAVFALAAVINGFLAVHEARAAGARPAPAVTAERIRLSLHGYRDAARQWRVLAAVSGVGGGLLLMLQPTGALLAGLLALLCLYRARRAERTGSTLRRITTE